VDSQLFDVLRDMRRELTDNHVEVVQRLTALEKASAPIEEIERRVKRLEGWRNFVVGIAVTLGFMLKTAMGYFGRH
jgi:hypothetical protein